MKGLVITFANDRSTVLGGVEFFNFEFEKRLIAEDYQVFRARSSAPGFATNCVARLIKTLLFLCKNKERSYRIIVQHGSFLDVLATLAIAVLIWRRIEVISHIGDSWFHAKNRFLNRLSRRIFNLCLKNLWIIAEKQKSIFRGVESKKVHTLIASELTSISCSNTRSGSSPPYILFLGRVTEKKGAIDLMSVIDQVPNSYEIWFVGPADMDVKKYHHSLPVSQKRRLRLIGSIYEVEEKVALIDGCDFMVYPSYEDAFPLTVIEGFARGRLVISSDISETINFVEFEKLLIQPGDRDKLSLAINVLINIPADTKHVMLKRMMKKAKAYSENAILRDMGF